MTKTFQDKTLFGFSNFGHLSAVILWRVDWNLFDIWDLIFGDWNLFDIWDLIFGVSISQ